MSATLGAHLSHDYLLGYQSLFKVINSLCEMSFLAPREMETRQSCVICECHSGCISDSSLFVSWWIVVKGYNPLKMSSLAPRGAVLMTTHHISYSFISTDRLPFQTYGYNVFHSQIVVIPLWLLTTFLFLAIATTFLVMYQGNQEMFHIKRHLTHVVLMVAF